MTDATLAKDASRLTNKRYSGILVHPTCFPSGYGIGDLGDNAYEFIDYLVSAGQSLWQVLPLGPTGYGDSPYQGFSAFAGQPLIISPQKLADIGLLTKEKLEDYPLLPTKYVDFGAVISAKNALFKSAFEQFETLAPSHWLVVEYEQFCSKNAFWLKDYTLFMALKEKNEQKCWLEWRTEFRMPSDSKKNELHRQLKNTVIYFQFVQFIFFKQWFELKDYANAHGVRIVGDIPIFVSLDSVDVWANQDLFSLDKRGYPAAVAGVPPDYFSATGQLWGNPLYDWEVHEKQGFQWWIDRIRCQLQLVDFVRIDHFRGFDSYWAVPYGSKTAIVGAWMEGPKKKLFSAIQSALGTHLPIWAEDLGLITESVQELRDAFHFPGMKILQFALENPQDNDMMPEHHIPNCICYTGTHDNDTTLGWFYHLDPDIQHHVSQYMHSGAALIPWAFIRTALESAANYVILPLQDIMSLDSSARMNTPGKAQGNWSWRFESKDLDRHWADYLSHLTKESHR